MTPAAPPDRSLILGLGELASLFRRSRATVSRYVARLMSEHGFPQPLPGQKPRLWSRHQVELWLNDAAGTSAGIVTPQAVPAEDPRLSPAAIAAGRARLEARYGAGR